MTEPLAVIIAPDLVSVDQQSVLNAALYFDVVYADCYSLTPAGPDRQIVKQSDQAIEISLESTFDASTSFAPLRDAKILLRPPGSDSVQGPSVEMGDVLPEPLQRLVSQSVRGGAVLSVIEWVINAVLSGPRPGRKASEQPSGRQLQVKLPATIGIDSLSEGVPAITRPLALSLQLATMLNTLEVSASCAATPLLDSLANAQLAQSIAMQFPAIAAALSRQRITTLPWKHATVANSVLNDTLLNVRVRDSMDILHLREILAPELFAFRAELSRLTTLLKCQPWEVGFADDIEVVIATSIRPQLAALERRLMRPSRRMLKHLVSDWKSVSAVSLVPFSACVLQGADIAWATLAGACAGLGLGAIRTKLEEWSTQEESALTFLVEIRRKRQRRGRIRGT